MPDVGRSRGAGLIIRAKSLINLPGTLRSRSCSGPGSRGVSYREMKSACRYRFLDLAAAEANDQTLGLHVAGLGVRR
jgi:hypothetical protein